MRVEPFDGPAGGGIDFPGAVVIQVVAEVRADDDERFRPAPQRLDHVRHLGRVRFADDQRHDGEIVQHHLQERQVDLEAVFELVGGVEDLDPGQAGGLGRPVLVHRDVSQGRPEDIGAAQRQPPDRHPVTRTQQHHPFDGRRRRGQPRVRGRGDGAGIDVTGMGRDDGLGHRGIVSGAGIFGGFVKEAPDRCFQFAGVAGIELAGDGGLSDRGHGGSTRG